MKRRTFLEKTAVVATAALAGAAPSRAAAGTGWQVGIYTRPWAELDWRSALDAAAEASFRHVGLMTTNTPSKVVISEASTPEETVTVAAELKKRNLTALSAWGGNSWFTAKDGAATALRRLLDRCAAAGVPSLLIGGFGKEDQAGPYLDAIREAGDHAAKCGVRMAIKPHGGLNATGPQCRDMVRRVNHPAFRIWYDAGNILYYSDGKVDPVEDLKAVDGLVTGWCIKDFAAPKNVALTPGTGQVDFARVFAGLRAGGFTGGPLVIECLGPVAADQRVAEARKAREFVERLVGAA